MLSVIPTSTTVVLPAIKDLKVKSAVGIVRIASFIIKDIGGFSLPFLPRSLVVV